MSKINLILLLTLCLGYSSRLYGVQQQDEWDEQKQNYGNNEQKEEKALTGWECKSIEACSALVTIIDCLKYWQKLNDVGKLKNIFGYLSASNNYRGIINAYHHLLDKHLCDHKNNRKEFQFINESVRNAVHCSFKTCQGYGRNQRARGKKEQNQTIGDSAVPFWQCALCGLKNYIAVEHCKACFKKKNLPSKYRKRDIDMEYIFLRDLLDTIHGYLVHGKDSGHRYIKDDSHINGQKDTDDLFDYEIQALKKWQARIKKERRNQNREDKFQTKIRELEDSRISLALLKGKFGDDKAFKMWIQYLKENECDTDNIFQQIYQGDNDGGMVYDNFKLENKEKITFFNKVKVYMQQHSQKNEKTRAYDFGVRLYYWDYYQNSNEEDWDDEDCRDVNYNPGYRQKDLFVPASYASLKDEILAKGISIDTWNQKYYEAKILLHNSQTLKKPRASHWNGGLCHAYDIKDDSCLTVWHVLSVIFYTNFTGLCTSFGLSFRYLSDSKSLEDIIKRNSKWHFLSKYLREVVEVFGTIILEKGNFYHGVSCLLFSQFSAHLYGPLSTSKKLEVALLFTETSSGLILELKPGVKVSLKFFNVSLISCFSSEDERLFIGGEYPLQISTIRLLGDNLNIKPMVHCLFLVHSMIKGEWLDDNDKVAPSDIAIFSKLISGDKNLPPYIQQVWNKFRKNQQAIKINMRYMYDHYKLFLKYFTSSDPKCKNLLLLDQIAIMFPNVTKVISEITDNTTGGYAPANHSSGIVSSYFILGVQEMLSKLERNKQNRLTKIIIQTDRAEIKNDYKIYGLQSDTLGWYVGQGVHKIVFAKNLYDDFDTNFIPKISTMIQGTFPPDEITSLDVKIFEQLTSGAKEVPTHVRLMWDKFRYQQASLKISLLWIRRNYKIFLPLLFSLKLERKNLLYFDKIVEIFPNVTEIICTCSDCIGTKYNDYSPAIVGSNFIFGLKEMLRKMDKDAMLKKIIIKTKKHQIEDSCDLYVGAFRALGWQIQKGSYFLYGAFSNADSEYENNQITLTKISCIDMAWACYNPYGDAPQPNDHRFAQDNVFDLD